MISTIYKSLRLAFALIVIFCAASSLISCSTEKTAAHQQGITDAHRSMIDRREARQQARDERFQASRDSWMN